VTLCGRHFILIDICVAEFVLITYFTLPYLFNIVSVYFFSPEIMFTYITGVGAGIATGYKLDDPWLGVRVPVG
jgi:hypothetical protein